MSYENMMSFEDVVRIFLGSYFTFVAVAYTAKTLAFRHRRGISAIAQTSSNSLQSLTHGLFGVFRALIWAVCVIRIFVPSLDYYLIIFTPMNIPSVQALGVTLLFVSFVGIVYVHTYMGEAWRSGVTHEGARGLIIDGPYALTRNPIFMLIGVGQLGFFLSLPSLFSLVCLGVGFSMLVLQTRIEEYALSAQFGSYYQGYKDHTPRWLFGHVFASQHTHSERV
jgi:protein-S-isoprenylcysteine O-methyltransferase Ste14